jgi:hypothetical protein
MRDTNDKQCSDELRVEEVSGVLDDDDDDNDDDDDDEPYCCADIMKML